MKKINNSLGTVAIIDLSYIYISFILAFMCIIIRDDYIGDVIPGYYNIHTDINMLNYFITQEANYLLIVSALVTGFIAVNAVMLFICKRKASEIPEHRKKCLYMSFGIFAVNMAAVFISGFIVSDKFTSGEIIEIAENSGNILQVTAHHMYFLIDIIFFVFLIEVTAALVIKRTLVYDRLLFIIFSFVPFTICPLFFV